MVCRWALIFILAATPPAPVLAASAGVDEACQLPASAGVDDGTWWLSAEDDGCALKLLQLAVSQRQRTAPDTSELQRSEGASVGDGEDAIAQVLAQRVNSASEVSVKLQKRATALRAHIRDFVQHEATTDEHHGEVQKALLESLGGGPADKARRVAQQAFHEDGDLPPVPVTGELQEASGEEDLKKSELQQDLQEEIEHEGQLENELEQELKYEKDLEDELSSQHRRELKLEDELHIEHDVLGPGVEHGDELGEEPLARDESHARQESLEHEHEKEVEQELESELGYETDANRHHEVERELDDVLAHDQLEHDHEEEQAREHDEYQNEERREHELEDELVHDQDEQQRMEIRKELEDVLAREQDEDAYGHWGDQDSSSKHENEIGRQHGTEDELGRQPEDVPARGHEDATGHSHEGHHTRDEALRHKLEDEVVREHNERKHDELQRELDDVLEREHEREKHEEDADSLSRHLCLPQNVLNFSTSIVAHSNLGGAGPDDGDETLLYESVAIKDGMPVDLVISATTEYTPGEADKNGIHGGVFGLINLRVDSRADLLFRFLDRAGAPVELGPFYFTFFDIDQGMAHDSRKSVVAHGLSDFKLAEHTELTLEYLDDNSVRFRSSERGNREDNPSNPLSLTQEAAERTVTLVFPKVSEFSISLEEANYADASHGRNFLFSGPSSMVCGKERTCTDYQCPRGYHVRTMAEFLLCADQRCTSSDRDTCCFKETAHIAA